MMTLIRHQPWFFINRWHPDFDRLFGESLGGPTDDTAWTPSVDVHEEDDRFLLSADMPGVEAKDIEVSAEDGVLTIRAERLTRSARGQRQRRKRQERFRHVPAPNYSAGRCAS